MSASQLFTDMLWMEGGAQVPGGERVSTWRQCSHVSPAQRSRLAADSTVVGALDPWAWGPLFPRLRT